MPRTVVLLCLALVVVGSSVSAQERSGLVGGLSIGGGSLRARGAPSDPTLDLIAEGPVGGAFGTSFYLGAVTSRRTALLVEGAVAGRETSLGGDGEVRFGDQRVTFSRSREVLMSFVGLGVLQYWVTPHVWVRGGLGGGSLSRDAVLEDASLTIGLSTGSGFAVMAAAGVEVLRRRNFGLDVQVHFTSLGLRGLRVNAPTIRAGFTWY